MEGEGRETEREWRRKMGKTNDERRFFYCLLIVMVIAAKQRGVYSTNSGFRKTTADYVIKHASRTVLQQMINHCSRD